MILKKWKLHVTKFSLYIYIVLKFLILITILFLFYQLFFLTFDKFQRISTP